MGFGVSYLRPFAFEKITVGQSSTALTPATYLDTANANGAAAKQSAMEAVISVETQSVRFRTDGGVPTSTDGHLITANTFITVSNLTAIKNFRAYAPTGTATLQVTYYNG